MPFGCTQFQYFNGSYNKNNPPSIIDYAIKEVEEYLEYIFSVSGAPSLSYGIVYDDDLIYYRSYGVTKLGTNKKPTADSIYRIGSISKVFTVLMTYVLRDMNKLSFDDPIYKYNNNFGINNPWGITNKERLGQTLTIKQLASQISGLPREAPCIFEANDCINITTNEIFKRLQTISLIHPTDVQASYSNLAYAILGNVLSESNSYSSYTDALDELVIDPLKLTNTGLYLSTQQQQYATTGYNSSYVDQGYVDIGWVGPAGQLFSSVNDLTTLMKQYFASYPSRFQQSISGNTNFLTSPQTYREMLRSVFINPDEQTGFGSPWEMQMLNGHYLRGKGGNINGFSSDIQMIPEMKLGVISLSNYELDASMFGLGSLEILIPAFKSWLNMQQSDYKTYYGYLNITDFVGTYLYDGVPFFNIYIDYDTNNLMLSSALQGLYGILVWAGEDVNDGITMIFNDLYDQTQSCWITTLDGIDGTTLQFTKNSNGNINGLILPDNDWSLVFTKKNLERNSYNYTKKKMIKNKMNGKFKNSRNHRNCNDKKRRSKIQISSKFV